MFERYSLVTSKYEARGHRDIAFGRRAKLFTLPTSL